jgi:hypothetical protein
MAMGRKHKRGEYEFAGSAEQREKWREEKRVQRAKRQEARERQQEQELQQHRTDVQQLCAASLGPILVAGPGYRYFQQGVAAGFALAQAQQLQGGQQQPVPQQEQQHQAGQRTSRSVFVKLEPGCDTDSAAAHVAAPSAQTPQPAATAAPAKQQLTPALQQQLEQAESSISKGLVQLVQACGRNAAAQAVLAVIKSRKHSLASSFEDSSDVEDLIGLQALAQVVHCLQEAPAAALLPLLQCMTAAVDEDVARGSNSSSSSSSVLDVLLCCWLREVQMTGCPVQKAAAAAAQGPVAEEYAANSSSSSSGAATASASGFLAGLCHLVLQLLAAYTAAAAAAAEAPAAPPAAADSAAIRLASELLQGTALLLLHLPQHAACAELRSEQAGLWRQSIWSCIRHSTQQQHKHAETAVHLGQVQLNQSSTKAASPLQQGSVSNGLKACSSTAAQLCEVCWEVSGQIRELVRYHSRARQQQQQQ